MDRITTISNLVNKIPQLMKQDGDMAGGTLNYPLSRLNNIIIEAEAELTNLIEPFFNIEGSKIQSWASHPEPLSDSSTKSGDILKSNIEIKKDSPTQFITIEFFEDGGDIKFRVISDFYGTLGQGTPGNEFDSLSVAGFKIKAEAFSGEFSKEDIFSFSIYQHHLSLISIYSLKAAVAVLKKIFTQDMPESPGTAEEYEKRLNQFLSQMRNGRAYLKASEVVLDTTPIGMDYEIDETGTDITDYLTD